MEQQELDRSFMEQAMTLATQAEALDEVPVGAVIVQNGRVIATACNLRERSKCATHHAEILAIEEACKTLGGWRLPNSTLYVTLEPCPMCAGAIVNARIDRVVFGAYDPKGGAFGSVVNLNDLPLNHKPIVLGGVMEEACRTQLTNYFRGNRKRKEEA